MRIVFLGTPDFAVPSLKAILASRHEILAVVTQPDKPVGRSGKIVFNPVKQVAVENSLKVLQYDKIRYQGVEDLKALAPDIMVTCAFGQILSKEIIDIAPHGIINVHGSILPKYRGASPIQWSVINGDNETGITIMKTEEGIDTGDIIAVKKTLIGENETAGELFDRLADIGAKLITQTLDDIEDGKATFTPQNHELATTVKMLKKEDGLLDFSKNTVSLKNFVRGMNPWPCAFTYFRGKLLKVFAVECVEGQFCGEYGCAVNTGSKGIYIKCECGAIRITELQLEGGKRMKDSEFLLGHKIIEGEKFGK